MIKMLSCRYLDPLLFSICQVTETLTKSSVNGQFPDLFINAVSAIRGHQQNVLGQLSGRTFLLSPIYLLLPHLSS